MKLFCFMSEPVIDFNQPSKLYVVLHSAEDQTYFYAEYSGYEIPLMFRSFSIV